MMSLFGFVGFSIVYLMVMHLALSIPHGFHLFMNISFFVVGGVIGFAMDSYITGFVFAVVMHLLFWSHGGE